MSTRARRFTIRHGLLLLGLASLAGCEALAGLSGERSFREPAVSNGGRADSGGARSDEGGTSGEPSAAGAGATDPSAGAADAGEGGLGGAEGGAPNAGVSGVSGVSGGGFGGVYGTDAPSCVGMDADETGGAGGIKCRGVSCCSSLLVPGGTFLMGRSESGTDADQNIGADSDQPEHSVTVSPFALDQFEVTVGRFRRFVDQFDGKPPAVGAGANQHIAASGWQSIWNDKFPASIDALRTALKCRASTQTWTDAPGFNETLPQNCVNWFEAFAFCAWDHARLPTEAEWEFAAAGGDQNRYFPWQSGPPTADKANYNCVGSGDLSCSFADLVPVGSKPDGDGRYGQADLAGSMWELTRDAYDQDFYASAAASGSNPANLNTNKDQFGFITTRGGDWVGGGALLRVAIRNTYGRSSADDGVGFRCARDL